MIKLKLSIYLGTYLASANFVEKKGQKFIHCDRQTNNTHCQGLWFLAAVKLLNWHKLKNEGAICQSKL